MYEKAASTLPARTMGLPEHVADAILYAVQETFMPQVPLFPSMVV